MGEYIILYFIMVIIKFVGGMVKIKMTKLNHPIINYFIIEIIFSLFWLVITLIAFYLDIKFLIRNEKVHDTKDS